MLLTVYNTVHNMSKTIMHTNIMFTGLCEKPMRLFFRIKTLHNCKNLLSNVIIIYQESVMTVKSIRFFKIIQYRKILYYVISRRNIKNILKQLL